MTDISFQALMKNVSITHYTAVKIETSESNERRNSEGKNIQFTVGNSGKEPKSYQHRSYIFHSLITSHGYFQKM